MKFTYLTTTQLAERINYQPRTITNALKDSVFIEGEHYIRPFGGRKTLYLWEPIEETMLGLRDDSIAIPMANGGVAHV